MSCSTLSTAWVYPKDTFYSPPMAMGHVASFQEFLNCCFNISYLKWWLMIIYYENEYISEVWVMYIDGIQGIRFSPLITAGESITYFVKLWPLKLLFFQLWEKKPQTHGTFLTPCVAVVLSKLSLKFTEFPDAGRDISFKTGQAHWLKHFLFSCFFRISFYKTLFFFFLFPCKCPKVTEIGNLQCRLEEYSPTDRCQLSQAWGLR